MGWNFLWFFGVFAILFLALANLFRGTKPLPGEDGYEEYQASLELTKSTPGSSTTLYVVALVVLAGLVLWLFNYYHLEIVKYFSS